MSIKIFESLVDILKSPTSVCSVFGGCLLLWVFDVTIGPFNLLFSITGVAVLINFTKSIYEILQKRYKIWKTKKATLRRLHNLTPGEKQILQYYINLNIREQNLKLSSGVVNELCTCGIIYRSASIGGMDWFAYNIYPWVKEYLDNNKYLVGL